MCLIWTTKSPFLFKVGIPFSQNIHVPLFEKVLRGRDVNPQVLADQAHHLITITKDANITKMIVRSLLIIDDAKVSLGP